MKKMSIHDNRKTVILPSKGYEHLHDLEEIFEQMEIKSMLEKRLSNYNPKNNKSWDDIRKDK